MFKSVVLDMRKINEKDCKLSIFHISGTIKKTQKYAIEFVKNKISNENYLEKEIDYLLKMDEY
jgi:RNase P/RNase MRP subunit POP5